MAADECDGRKSRAIIISYDSTGVVHHLGDSCHPHAKGLLFSSRSSEQLGLTQDHPAIRGRVKTQIVVCQQ